MVEGEGNGQHGARHDLAATHHGLLAASRHAEDGHFRVVDDGNGARAAEGADIGHGEGAAAKVVESRLALANASGEGGQLAGQVHHGLLVHVADHRHDQSPLGGHGDAQVAVALEDELPRPRIQARVELRILLEGQGRRLQEEAREGQHDAPLLRRLEAPRDDGVEIGDVGLVEVGHVGNQGGR